MICNPQIPLHRLVLSLSEALDHVSPAVADHQLRVAYISTAMARVMGYRGSKLRDIFHAGALHDIGLIRAENRIRAVAHNVLEGIEWHGEAGYELLRDNEFFAEAAPIVRHHHVKWDHGRAEQAANDSVPLASHILALADMVDRSIKRDTPILHQTKKITERISDRCDKEFHPDCVQAFREASTAPAFWLDVTSKRIYAILSREVDWPTLTVDEVAMKGISHIFGRVVDSLSPWTGTHSAGVAASSVALSQKLNFSPREQVLMDAAGYLHDLGKITVASKILDKHGKPDEAEWAILKGHTYYTFRVLDTIGGMPQISEWAAFHHERLDGKGYPFGHGAKELTLGSRIMAVADTFTAITEDRPYRAGMNEQQALQVLDGLVANGGLDGEVVTALHHEFEQINTIRKERQTDYAVKQKQLMEMIGDEQSQKKQETLA